MKKQKKRAAAIVAAPPPRLATDLVAWLIILAAAILILASLGQRCLWQDEAQVGMLGRNVLKFGRPIVFDGVNLVSQEAGHDHRSDLVWFWTPWIEIYIAAAGQKWLGLTAFAARLPFAILGILTLPLTYLAAARAFASRFAARLAVAFLGLSVPFLLHVRQVRWPGPVFFLVPVLLIATFAMRTRGWAMALFVIAGTLLFYTQYFLAVGLVAAVAAASIVLDGNRAFLTRMAIAAGVTALLCIPGLLFFRALSHAGGSGAQFGMQFRIYAVQLCTFILPLPLIIAAPMLAPQRERRTLWFLLAVIALYVVAMACGPWRMFRYLTPLLPIAAIVLGGAVAWLTQRSRNAGIVAIALLVGTNLLHQVPFAFAEAGGTQQAEPRFLPLVAYLGEIVNGVRDADCVVADYLKRNAQPGDTVIATYSDLPLMFYTGLHVGGGLAGQPLPDAPEWIVFHPFRISDDPMKDGRVIDWARHHVDLTRYVEALAVADPMLGNAPDPAFHRYSDAADARELKLLRRVR